MTIEEKRAVLKEYCEGECCDTCLISDCCADFLLGRWLEPETVNDLSVIGAYELIFGGLSKPTCECSAVIPDMVNHPSHYETGKYECIDVMLETQGKDAVLNFCLCNAFKYLYRHNRKNGIEDVKKAKWYVDKYIELVGDDK